MHNIYKWYRNLLLLLYYFKKNKKVKKNVNNWQWKLFQCCILIKSSNEIVLFLNVTTMLISFNEELR